VDRRNYGLREVLLAVAVVIGAVSSVASASAATIISSSSVIDWVETYTDYPTGTGRDAVFQLASSRLETQCPHGFWIRASDPGAKSTLAQVMAAYLAGKTIVAWVDTSVICSGSSSAACLVWNVRTT
jgi:hypothetical protein